MVALVPGITPVIDGVMVITGNGFTASLSTLLYAYVLPLPIALRLYQVVVVIGPAGVYVEEVAPVILAKPDPPEVVDNCHCRLTKPVASAADEIRTGVPLTQKATDVEEMVPPVTDDATMPKS